MATPGPIPAYETLLAAYHRAFAKELQSILEDLPVCSGDRVLDAGCGDGDYTRWLAPLVGPQGRVTGVDLLPAYLKMAEEKSKASPYVANIRFKTGNIARLPFMSGAFDLA